MRGGPGMTSAAGLAASPAFLAVCAA
ncbi:hypothetical protein GA0115246_102702, partial [Streptomyces sp. SolWspMP-sol7th]